MTALKKYPEKLSIIIFLKIYISELFCGYRCFVELWFDGQHQIGILWKFGFNGG